MFGFTQQRGEVVTVFGLEFRRCHTVSEKEALECQFNDLTPECTKSDLVHRSRRACRVRNGRQHNGVLQKSINGILSACRGDPPATLLAEPIRTSSSRSWCRG